MSRATRGGRGTAPFRSGALGALAIGLILTGCAPVGPDFAQPQTPVMKAWLAANSPAPDSATGLTARSQPVIAWWETFQDPILDRLIAQAYAENLSLQVAGARVLQARAQLGIAYGEMFPQSQAVGASYTQRKISENLGAVSDIDRVIPLDLDFATSQVGFDAQWEIDVFGGQRRGVQSARSNLAAQVAGYDDALITLTGDVAAVYIDIRALQRTIAIARENIALQEEGLRITKVRFDNGVTTDLDVDEATALLDGTRALVPALQTDLEQSENALAVLLGQPPASTDKLVGASGRIPAARVDVATGIPAELLRRRPDIRAAEFEAAAQSAQVGVALSDLYPKFGLTGSIGFQASSGQQLFNSDSLTGLVSPGVVWNVFNYGQIRNNVRAQDAAYQALIANYQNTVLSAYAEVQNAMVAYRNAGQQVAFLESAVAASERATRLALSQYGDGITDYSRVLNTQNALLRLEVSLIDARRQVSSNLVALYKALGGGWQIRAGREFLPDTVLAEMAHRTDWGDLLETTAN